MAASEYSPRPSANLPATPRLCYLWSMPRARTLHLAATAVVLAIGAGGAGCEVELRGIDGRPVVTDFSSGMPLVGACVVGVGGCDGVPLPMVIDTATPLTIITPEVGATVERRTVRLDLLATGPTGWVPRARFDGIALLAPAGRAGVSAPTLGAILGGDFLVDLALRIDVRAGELRFFPDISGADETHNDTCEAVVRASPAGGGDFTLAGGEVSFVPTRIVLPVCLSPDLPRDAAPRGEGEDGALVLATGLDVTVLSRGAWLRARAAEEGGPVSASELDALPGIEVYLPGMATPAAARLGSLRWLAIATDPLDEAATQRGPCAELLGNRVMTRDGTCMPGSACHCAGSAFHCAAGAAVELAGPIPVAVVADEEPFLQALRSELRPEAPDVVGLLAMGALAPLVTDLDYPNGRVMFRCRDLDDPTCKVRPAVATPEDRERLIDLGCALGRQATGIPY